MQKIWMRAKVMSIFGIIAMTLMSLGSLSPETVYADQNKARVLPVVDGETRLFPGYPRHFDGYGLIDRLGDKEIVISDSLLSLPSRADLHTPRSSSAGIGRFAVGDYVGYQLDDSGAIESMWLLQKGKR